MASKVPIAEQPEQKKLKLESGVDDDDEWWRNDEFYAPNGNGYREINPKEMREYIDHLNKSDGYDVPDVPEKTIFYGIHPCGYSSHAWVYWEVEQGSIAAIKQYNEKEGTKFQYYRIVKVNREIVSGVIYYITFLAEDLANKVDSGSSIADLGNVAVGPNGGCLVELQAKVYYPIADLDENYELPKEVMDFRVKKNLSDEGLEEHRSYVEILEKEKAAEKTVVEKIEV